MGQKHGQSKTRLYGIYNGMKQRCNNPKDPGYKYYGAKGIKVCEEWQNDFLSFREWALSHGYDDTLTIDRIDPKKGYCPGNCRWLTRSENAARTKYSKSKDSYKKAMSGYMRWYRKQYEVREASKRIAEIDAVIKELPDLNDEQLRLVLIYIEWLKAADAANERMKEHEAQSE